MAVVKKVRGKGQVLSRSLVLWWLPAKSTVKKRNDGFAAKERREGSR